MSAIWEDESKFGFSKTFFILSVSVVVIALAAYVFKEQDIKN